ncbi:hypothetical protein EDC01DRAFT_696751 [Geopyxis carbonaria]|nr:hypothetical protein EDC01DRAFT_696751 [Geopyxis carbonaria]
MATALQLWALPALKPLLPLPDEDLQQAIAYAASLGSPADVSGHFKDFLGESSESLSFISEFNARLFPQQQQKQQSLFVPPTSTAPSSTSNSDSGAPSRSAGGGGGGKKKKGKQPLRKFAHEPRQANDGPLGFANPQGLYIKKDIEDEYYTGGSGSANNSGPNSRRGTPGPEKQAQKQQPQQPQQAQQTKTAAKVAGTLTSDFPNVKTKKPKPSAAAKVSLTGGTSMRGASSELTDLEAALRQLEVTTNPTLAPSERRRCTCQGLKHEVLAAAPNCLACGKIVCIAEGLGPCTFCAAPLLSSGEVQDMIASLRSERGRERMAADAAANRRPDVATTPRPFSTPPAPDDALAKAQAHRDRLLGFQAHNAQRTKIIDQASDFETPNSGAGNLWATPTERALQLKRQQKALAAVEWAGKQEYEKRRVVVAIDLKGRRVVREMQSIAAPSQDVSDDEGEGEGEGEGYDPSLERGGANAMATRGARQKGKGKGGEGTYSNNPLLGAMLRPVYTPAETDGKGKGRAQDPDVFEGVAAYANRNFGWRRVQDSLEDNEEVILNGGAFGGGGGQVEEVVGG